VKKFENRFILGEVMGMSLVFFLTYSVVYYSYMDGPLYRTVALFLRGTGHYNFYVCMYVCTTLFPTLKLAGFLLFRFGAGVVNLVRP